MHLLPDNTPAAAVQLLHDSAPLVRSQQREERPALFAGRPTSKTVGQGAFSPRTATLPGLPVELIHRICAELDPVDLRNLAASSSTLANTVDTRRWRQAWCTSYGEPDSPQAVTAYRQFYPLYKRFQDTPYPALFGQRALPGSVQPTCAAQNELSCQQVLDCALGLRIRSQSGALKPVIRWFHEAIGSPVWSIEWMGEIAGWGHCLVERLTAAGHDPDSFCLPVKMFDPHKGLIDIASLPVSCTATLGSESLRNEGGSQVVPSPVQVTVLRSGTVVARNPFCVQLWYLRDCDRKTSPPSETLPVSASTVVAEAARGCIAIGRQCGNIQLWTLSPARCLWGTGSLHGDAVVGLISVAGGRLVSASIGGVLKMWQADPCKVVASHRVPPVEQLSGIEHVLPERFITRSIRDVLRVWMISETGFDCVARLDPYGQSRPKQDLHDENSAARIATLWQFPPFFLTCNLITLANGLVIRGTSRRDLDLGSESDIADLLELYDLNAPRSPYSRVATWRDMNDLDTTVPVREPRLLPERVCDGSIMFLKELPDGRILVGSSRQVVVYDPSSDDVLEVLYCPHNRRACLDTEPPWDPWDPLAGGCVSGDGFIWLLSRNGNLGVIDLFANIKQDS